MSLLSSVHHVAIIATDIKRSIAFYKDVLGFTVVAEHYRSSRNSWKIDLSLNGQYVIELFSFEGAPPRPSRPEAAGLRHLAFSVPHLEEAVRKLHEKGVVTEPIRTDEYTGKRFTFFADPDNLPLELYEQ